MTWVCWSRVSKYTVSEGSQKHEEIALAYARSSRSEQYGNDCAEYITVIPTGSSTPAWLHWALEIPVAIFARIAQYLRAAGPVVGQFRIAGRINRQRRSLHRSLRAPGLREAGFAECED